MYQFDLTQHAARGTERLHRSRPDLTRSSENLGRRHGLEGILKFTEPQTVAVQRLVPAYSPFGGISVDRFTRLIQFLTRVFRRLPFYK